MTQMESATNSNDGTITFEPVLVKNIYGAENPSQMKVITRTFAQRAKRSAKRSGKVYVAVLCILPIAIFVHILLAVALLAILGATALFFWGLGDRVTFEYVEGQCPVCKTKRLFKPFGTGRVKFPLQVHCAECGNTFTAATNDH
jgi:hypothetical protein